MLIADVVQMVYKCFVFSGYCGLVVCDAGPALTQRLEGPGCEERGTGRSATTNDWRVQDVKKGAQGGWVNRLT